MSNEEDLCRRSQRLRWQVSGNTMISFKAALELGVEIKEYTEENVDLTVTLLTVVGRL